jgi:hypothetical protein
MAQVYLLGKSLYFGLLCVPMGDFSDSAAGRTKMNRFETICTKLVNLAH